MYLEPRVDATNINGVIILLILKNHTARFHYHWICDCVLKLQEVWLFVGYDHTLMSTTVSYLFVNWHVDGDKLSYSIVVLHNPISNPYLGLLYVKDHLYYGRCIISGLSKEPHIRYIPILLSAFPSLWQMVSWSLPEKFFKSLFMVH